MNENEVNESGVDEGAGLGAQHLRARIAWYYYIAGLTQQEISERLGIERVRLHRNVGQQHDDG